MGAQSTCAGSRRPKRRDQGKRLLESLLNGVNHPLVVVKGGGDLASGVAHRLHQVGFSVLILELARPLTVRRTVAFASAMLEGQIVVEGVCARRVLDLGSASQCMSRGEIAVMDDARAGVVAEARPAALVDAIMAKANIGTRITDAPIVVGLGPGFTAGDDVHAVVETNRGHHLGRVYYQGGAEADTDEPSSVQGYTHERVLRAPAEGEFHSACEIGQMVATGTVVGRVDGQPVLAAIGGVVRGLIASGTIVRAGWKIGDIDPRCDVEHCFTISDKSRAVAGGVLEAILHCAQRRPKAPA
ncbi:MAG: EF2563 family selenium-dependent molybdenum hydroxylase system protein [Chloroflexi bacterium]|nr:EF2563 family selenium-dependent molybdenum hydroxylase system protein [Chloroflexota bacterium]